MYMEDTITHRQVQSNGITMHIAEAGQGPLVILLHGFPELWYSWRHQLPALAAADFNVGRYFLEPGIAEKEREADVGRTLRLFFYAFSGDAPADLIPTLFTKKPVDAGALDGMPEPKILPAWLSQADLDYNTQAFRR